MKKILLILIILLSSIIGKAYAEQVKLNIAVADFSAENVSASDAAIISNFFRTGLVNTNLFVVLERNNMDMILSEQKFQISGCTDFNCAVKMGKLLNVQKMVIGNLSVFAKQYYITASVVDVESGKVVCSEKVSCKKQEDLPNKAEDLAVLISEKMTHKKSESEQYSRRRVLKNSIRSNVGSFIFYGDAKDIASTATNFNISYRRQGIPLFAKYNTYTEIEAGYFSMEKAKDSTNPSSYKFEYIPFSVNFQYYLPIQFAFEVYSKTGFGASYGKSTVSSDVLNVTVSDTSIDPLVKVGIGIDFMRNYNIGFQVEVLYNQYFMKDANFTGITVNGGLSYNW